MLQRTSISTSSPRKSSTSMRWIVTRRGSRSTSMPARAYSYSALPSRLSAEYIGGTWSISPVKRAQAVSTCSRVTCTGRSASTSPSASPVVVRTPSRRRAR